jgi:hypothetical protein
VIDRRSFLRGIGLALAAPAIVRAASLDGLALLRPAQKHCFLVMHPSVVNDLTLGRFHDAYARAIGDVVATGRGFFFFDLYDESPSELAIISSEVGDFRGMRIIGEPA